MARRSQPTDFETELQKIPSVKYAVVTDLQGVVLLRAGSSSDEGALQKMAATFALTTDQANKLRLGMNKHITLFYGALLSSTLPYELPKRNVRTCDSSCHRHLNSCARGVLPFGADTGMRQVSALLRHSFLCPADSSLRRSVYSWQRWERR